MTEQEHTPEPWSVDYENIHTGSIATCHGTQPGWYEVWAPYDGGPFDQRANAHRIVACVNAMQGIRNPAGIRELVEAARAMVDADDECMGCEPIPMVYGERLRDALAALDAEESSDG